MNLYFNTDLANDYQNLSQKIRVMTEQWFAENGYCPCCGEEPISVFANNNPVGDFYCSTCQEQFELKSKNAKSVGGSIADGAYKTMLERINSQENPNFFFLMYQKRDFSVQQLIVVPKHFFTPQIIIPRKQGIPNRPDYIMCSINMAQLPESGKIKLIDNMQLTPKHQVINQWKQFSYLAEQKNIVQRGWTLDILKLLDKIPDDNFTLRQAYAFESELALKYPNNNHIKDKIRQQLQYLRDKNIIEFVGRGRYKKVR